jgi:hypothetical protein
MMGGVPDHISNFSVTCLRRPGSNLFVPVPFTPDSLKRRGAAALTTLFPFMVPFQYMAQRINTIYDFEPLIGCTGTSMPIFPVHGKWYRSDPVQYKLSGNYILAYRLKGFRARVPYAGFCRVLAEQTPGDAETISNCRLNFCHTSMDLKPHSTAGFRFALISHDSVRSRFARSSFSSGWFAGDSNSIKLTKRCMKSNNGGFSVASGCYWVGMLGPSPSERLQ